MAVREDHTFDLGEDWVIQITCHKDAAATQALDISGSGDVTLGVAGQVFDKTSGNTAITDGPNGVAVITVPPSAQAAIPAGAHYYVIRATSVDGSLSDQAFGVLTVVQTPLS